MFCPKPHYNKPDNLYKLYILFVSFSFFLDTSAKQQVHLSVIAVAPAVPGLILSESWAICRVGSSSSSPSPQRTPIPPRPPLERSAIAKASSFTSLPTTK